jgi:uncharacterized membrane protein
MEKQIKHISHKLIDSLSDGVYSIALTLLGLDVVALVSEVSHSKEINAALFEHWPTFFSYIFGFLVLFSMWYSYHALSQYVDGTNAWIVWNHGIGMLWIALMPFGVALLGETLNTPNSKWGVFYFGICLFGTQFSWLIQWAVSGFKVPVNFHDDLPIDPETLKRMMPVFFSITSFFGLALILLSLINPWLAMAGYAAHINTNATPVTSLSKFMVRLSKMV